MNTDQPRAPTYILSCSEKEKDDVEESKVTDKIINEQVGKWMNYQFIHLPIHSMNELVNKRIGIKIRK